MNILLFYSSVLAHTIPNSRLSRPAFAVFLPYITTNSRPHPHPKSQALPSFNTFPKSIQKPSPLQTTTTTTTTSPSPPHSPPRIFMSSTARTALDELSSDGAFKRTDATFRNWISAKAEQSSSSSSNSSSELHPFIPKDLLSQISPEIDPSRCVFPADKHRYHLYVSLACPWACRCLLVRAIKGLQDVIGVSVVHPTWQRTGDSEQDTHAGWVFRNPGDAPLQNLNGHGVFKCDEACVVDPHRGFQTVRQIYEHSHDTVGKYSVPVLWDTKEQRIVSNESAEIIRMLNSEFNHFATNKDLDLYPSQYREQIDEFNSWIYPCINNGVYRCGFATKQAPYEEAINDLYQALDRLEDILNANRYLCGNAFTEADVRLFVTLIRFDEVYAVYFKTNKKLLREYTNIYNYTREIYQMKGVAETVNFDHIKTHYYTSHPKLNYYGVIPAGPGYDVWKQPHGRDNKFA